MALTLRFALWSGASRSRGFRRRRLLPRVSWKLERSSNDAGDEGSIGIAYTAGLDAFKQRQALLSAQGEAKKAFEKFQPLKHRGGHRSLEPIYRLSGACLV
jgi:hypothetical protein